MDEVHHPIRAVKTHCLETEPLRDKDGVLDNHGVSEVDVSLLQPLKKRRLLCDEDVVEGSINNLNDNKGSGEDEAWGNTKQPHPSSNSDDKLYDVFQVLEEDFDFFNPESANALYLGEGDTTDHIKYNLNYETKTGDERSGGKENYDEVYDVFDTLKENFDWIKDGCTSPAKHIVEREDILLPRQLESGDRTNDSRSTQSTLPSAFSPSAWTKKGCVSGGNCNNRNCLNSDEDDQSSNNDISPPTCKSSLIEGKRIRISGDFQLYNTTQSECKELLLDAGALEVKVNTTLGDADILIAGRNCGLSLREEAERGRKPVLSYPELISSLQLDGYSVTLSNYNTKAVIDESELARKYINNSQFLVVDGGSKRSLKEVCRSVLPAELSKVYNNEGLIVETAETEFTDHLLLMKRDNKKKRPMRFRVTRIKQNNGASAWKHYYRFDHKIGNQWKPYCVGHDVQEDYCIVCNGCDHLDPVRGFGFPFPHWQCIECFPRIACSNCGIEPRSYNHSSYEEQYRNHCARCYRIATEGMSSEDRSVEYIRQSNIPISSANKYVFGLPYRPDAEITASPLNDISYEHDDKLGHVNRCEYPAHKQHQRTVELNKCRPKKKGKVTIRQHPLDTTDTVRQESQNALMVSTIKKYMNEDLGQREDKQGGKRIIVFIGHSRSNYHYTKAEEEKKNGYWDEVRLLQPYNTARDCPEPE